MTIGNSRAPSITPSPLGPRLDSSNQVLSNAPVICLDTVDEIFTSADRRCSLSRPRPRRFDRYWDWSCAGGSVYELFTSPTSPTRGTPRTRVSRKPPH